MQSDIFMNFHCRKCVEAYADGKFGRNKTMQELSRLEVGRTKIGVQVWCARHDILVTNIELPPDHRLMLMPLKCEICTGPDCEHVTN